MTEDIKKKVHEFNIPVPWGFIAVKAWGNPEDKPVLVTHGTGDNAGSFDNLIPLLPNGFYYICPDFPGYGHSSPFPLHMPLHVTDYVIAYRIVMDHFKRKRYTIIAHSLGASLAFLFCRMYPNTVEKIIAIDIIAFRPISAEEYVPHLRNKLDKFYEGLNGNEKISYEYEDLLQWTKNGRYKGGELTTEAAETLLKRALEPAGDGKYYVRTDLRVLSTLMPEHDSHFLVDSFKHDPVLCPVLIILARFNEYPRKTYKELFEYMKEQKNMKIVYVDGHHDVHNDNPELVAPHIRDFLLVQKSKM